MPARPPDPSPLNDAGQAARRRAERLRALHLVEIPRIRLAGYALLVLAVVFHNRLVFGTAGNWVPFGVAAMAYALAAALLLPVLHFRVKRFDPATIFLAADLPFWAAAVYVTGADRSWLFFIMVLRAADQTITTLRRAIIFAHLATAMYPAVIAYAVLVDGRPVSWPAEAAKTLVIYAASVYVSFIARTGERQRARRAEAQRLAEELSRTAQRQQLQLLRIFNATTDGIAFVAPDGRIESANTRAGELLGLAPEEIGGADAAEALGGDLREVQDGTPFSRTVRTLVENPVDAQGSLRNPRNGRILHWHARPTRDAHGAFLGLTVTLQDVTRPQELIGQLESNAKLLEEARRRAEAAARGRGEFVANITHELRTPLSAIIGFSQLALESGGEEHRRHLRRMKTTAESLLATINDILDYSKMDAGRLDLERVPFSLRSVVDEVLETIATAAEEKGIELTRHVEEDVADQYVGDPLRLHQVLLNLVGNGVKFTEQGGVNVRVRLVSQTEREAVLHFEVTDTGIGIPRDKLQFVFEAFAQADGSTTRRYGGTGLGLSIASRLTSLMGGDLWVESEPGHGSRFHFTTVLSVRTDPAPVEVASGSGAESSNRALVGARNVLMADDSPLHRELLSHLLRARGYTVIAAANGREALRAFEQARIDAVILDWQMPEMGGLETTQAIRLLERGSSTRVPIVAATAAVTAEDRSRGIAAGVDYFLTKPIPTGMLLSILEAGGRTLRTVTPQELEAGRDELRKRLGDEDLARRMIDLFLREGPRLLGELRLGLDQRDTNAVRRCAHSLHGAIANFPAPDARKVAAEMERHGLAGDLEAADRLFGDLQEAVQRMSLELPALF